MLCFATPVLAAGDGLAGSYWNFNVSGNGNVFPSGAPVLTRVDATVNFDWGGGSPAGAINADDFAVRWDGMLEAPQSGNYIFSTQSDDGVRLWINGALVIDNWTLHAPTWNDSAALSLVAGQRYVVRMEMFERGGGAVARLYWRKPSDIAAAIARNVIPKAQLFSQVSPTVVAVTQPCGDSTSVIVTFSRPMTSGTGGTGAERKQNYDVKGSAPTGINVTTAVLQPDQQTVILTLNKALIAGNSYTLEVKKVAASDGVAIVPDPITFTFVAGAGSGLSASYWNFDVFGSGNAFPGGVATHIRQDAPIDFNWATGSPVPGIINADVFAVRWDGFVEAPSTGNYTFWTQSDDGVRLWVNGNQAINNWTLHSATWDAAAPVALQAGQRYAIRMEMYELTGDAVARLHWQTPGSAVRVPVPASQLSSCGGATSIDHVRLLHPGIGLTCASSDITVQACANADCSVLATDAVTVNLSATPASVFTPNPVVLNGGSTVVQIRQTTPGLVTLDAIASAPLATNLTQCFDGATPTCVMDFRVSGFLFDVPTQTACKTSANVTIQAVRTDVTTQTCAPAFVGARSVNFWSEYVSPTSGTLPLNVDGSAIVGSAPGTPVTLNFDATASATLTVNYADAGQLNLHARYTGSGSDAGLVLDGVDAFVSKPVGFDVQSIPSSTCAALNTSCPVLAAAGADFAQSVRAVCWEVDGDSDFSNNQPTPNFQQAGIVLSHALLAPVGGNAGALLVGTATIASGGSGAVTFNQQYSEVGVIEVTATASNYLGAGPVSGMSRPMGRFTPHHFVVTAVSAPIHRSTTPACLVPPGSAFTYMDEPFELDFTLQARNDGNVITRNYDDGRAFSRLDLNPTLPTVAYLGLGAASGGIDRSARMSTDATSGAWNAGEARVKPTLHFARDPAGADGPFALAVGVAPVDADGIGLLAADLDLDLDRNGSNDHGNAATTNVDIRYGRLALYNAIGPELQPLDVPLQLEYFSSGGFVVNPLDSCTPLSVAGNLFLTNDDTAGAVEQPGTTAMTLNAGSTSASLVNTPPLNGVVTVRMSAPGADNTGFVDLRIDASAMPWLRFDWDGDGAADDDPVSRATFGVFRGPDTMIDMR